MKRGIDGLTDAERILLDALVRFGDAVKACEHLKITTPTGYQRLYRLRSKYQREKQFIEAYERYRIRIADKAGVYL